MNLLSKPVIWVKNHPTQAKYLAGGIVIASLLPEQVKQGIGAAGLGLVAYTLGKRQGIQKVSNNLK